MIGIIFRKSLGIGSSLPTSSEAFEEVIIANDEDFLKKFSADALSRMEQGYFTLSDTSQLMSWAIWHKMDLVASIGGEITVCFWVAALLFKVPVAVCFGLLALRLALRCKGLRWRVKYFLSEKDKEEAYMRGFLESYTTEQESSKKGGLANVLAFFNKPKA